MNQSDDGNGTDATGPPSGGIQRPYGRRARTTTRRPRWRIAISTGQWDQHESRVEGTTGAACSALAERGDGARSCDRVGGGSVPPGWCDEHRSSRHEIACHVL